MQWYPPLLGDHSVVGPGMTEREMNLVKYVVEDLVGEDRTW